MNRIDPDEISGRVAHAVVAAGRSPWLVGYDANGIQELITASGRPISMRGASEVILAFDEEARGDELTIFAGGGRGIALARSEREARTAVDAHVDRFRQVTRGGVMAACTVPLQLGGEPEAQSIRWLLRQLDLEKDATNPPAGVLPDHKDVECAYCCNYRGTRQRKRDDELEMVCARCDAMLERGRRAGKERGSRKGEMSRSIADIAKDGRIAVITADGNNLGALFASLRSLVELAAVSQAVATIFGSAAERALDRVHSDKRVPLASGGDDIRAFIPPAAVLPYVETLVDVVESSASEHARALAPLLSAEVAAALDTLGIGIGAVVANVYYPAWRLIEHAHVLERSAKAACYAKRWRSGFDFAVVTTEDSMAAEPDRADEDIRPLCPRTAAWRDAIRNTEALARIPSAQLAVLAAAQTLDQAELGNVLRYQVARSTEWQAWYTTCGVDWRVPEVVLEHRPDPGSLELARLLAHGKATA